MSIGFKSSDHLIINEGIKSNLQLQSNAQIPKYANANGIDESHSQHKYIILWGYFRGGSSFVGELLSANNKTVYFFEPLWLFEQNKIDDWKERRLFLEDLFACESEAVNNVTKHLFLSPKPMDGADECKVSTRVMKVNRFRGPEAVNWLNNNKHIQVRGDTYCHSRCK